MKIHPLAELFPMHDGDELQSLAANIKVKGLQEKIWLYEGKILDGRRRHAGCKIAKVQPEFQDYEGDDPLAFVLSKNLHRRHLNASERAMVAAEIANLERGNPKQNAYNGSKEPLSVSTETAAEMLNVSEASVKRAKKVNEEAAPEVVEAVKQGQATVSDAAKVASETKPVQAAAVQRVKQGDAKTLTQAVRQVKEDAEPPAVVDDHNTPIPERLIPVFSASKSFTKAAKAAELAATAMETAEATMAFDQLDESEKHKKGDRRLYSTYAKTAAYRFRTCRPSLLCPDCQGVEASRENDLCAKCEGKGWLTAQEAAHE